MTKPHNSEALSGHAVIETYAVLQLKFEEIFEDDHEIKLTITDEHETDETLKLECEIGCSTSFYLEGYNKHTWFNHRTTSCELKYVKLCRALTSTLTVFAMCPVTTVNCWSILRSIDKNENLKAIYRITCIGYT